MKNEIRSYLLEQQDSPAAGQIEDSESLLDAGIIDSMAMVDLINHLESRYGIAVDEEEMVPENFDSIDAIASYLEWKVAESGGSVSTDESSLL